MKRSAWIALAVLLPAVFLCTGCMVKALGGPSAITKSNLTPVKEIQGKLGPYENVIVLARTAPDKSFEKEAAYLQEQIIWQLKNLAVFTDVTPGTGEESTKNSLIVKVDLLEVHGVGSLKRKLMTVAAGSVSATTAVSFIDAMTKTEAGSYSLKADGVASGTTNEMLDKVAKDIADLVSQKMSQ